MIDPHAANARVTGDPMTGDPMTADPMTADPGEPDPHDHPHPTERAHPASRELPAYGTGHELRHAAHHAAVVLSEVTAGYDERAALTDITVAVATGTLLAVSPTCRRPSRSTGSSPSPCGTWS